MALVGNISSSISQIGVSGTLIVANQPDGLFPGFPGADVSFFVSGSIGGKGGASRTVSVFGGDAAVSGSLTVGTGSLKVTSNDLQFSSFSNRIELAGGQLKFYDSVYTAGKTLSDLFGGAGGSDTQVQYNNGGSLAGSAAFTFSSSESRLTVSQAAIATALTASTVKAGSTTVSLFDDTATTINFGAAATSLNMGAGAGQVTVAGDLQVSGNDIKMSGGTTALTFSGTGDVAVAGDLTVSGNDIKSSGGTTAITLSGANVIIPGDLTVNGTTVTADVTTVTVEDPLVALGFTSGSVAVSVGDRGFIGGLASENSVAMFWDESDDEFAVARTTSTPDATTVSVASYADFRAAAIEGTVITATAGFTGSLTKLTDGSNYLLAGSGISIATGSNGAVTISTGAGAGDVVGPASATDNAIARFDLTTGKLIQNSAITISDEAANSVTIAGSATATTVSLFPSTVTALNLGGASTVSTAAGGVQVGANLGVTGSAQFNGAVTLGDTSGDAISVIGTMTVTPNATFSGDIAVNGGDVTTTAATATVFNTNATTVSVFGAATALNIGSTVPNNQVANFCSSATGSVTLNIGSGATANGVTKAVNVGTGGVAGSTTNVTLGSSNGGTINSAGNFAVNSNKFTVSSATGNTAVLGDFAVNTNKFTVSAATGAAVVSGSLSVYGNVSLGDLSTDTITFTGQANSDLIPATDRLYNLGSATNRWNNIYTGDLHLRNERGNWTVIEEETYLSIRNNHTGRMFKFVLEEIPGPLEPLDE